MDTFKYQNEEINRLSVNMEEAVVNALECSRITFSCLQHCLALGGRHSDPKHISIMMECADLCHLASRFMMSTSDFGHDLVGVTARVCDACADSCNELDPEDSHMVACMVACRRCADSCRRMEH